MANTGPNKNTIVKFVKDEIEATESALAFVEAELAKGSTQHNTIYVRKRAEYSGMLAAYNAVLDVVEGRDSGS